jgi:hypothetical protein
MRALPLSVAVEAPVFVAEHSRGSHPSARERQDTQTSVGTHAGTYVYGSKGSNACPEGSTRIVNWLVCAKAADDSGQYFQGNRSTTSLPAGCIARWGSAYFFNEGSPGAANADTAPLCISGAPPRFCTANSSHPADTLGVLVRYYASTQAVFRVHSRRHLSNRFSSVTMHAACVHVCL